MVFFCTEASEGVIVVRQWQKDDRIQKLSGWRGTWNRQGLMEGTHRRT